MCAKIVSAAQKARGRPARVLRDNRSSMVAGRIFGGPVWTLKAGCSVPSGSPTTARSCLSGATIRAPRLTACGRCGLSSRSRSRPCYDEAVSSATGACS